MTSPLNLLNRSFGNCSFIRSWQLNDLISGKCHVALLHRWQPPRFLTGSSITTLSEFHIVFSYIARIHHNKDAFEWHLSKALITL